ncbi:AraC family transcriptional regulator [Chitinophaga eiseniae]|uniref:Helix-turn-helix transcriptional regulator n=1 Tax=Chitinophaga eiseniae TaxID=634771 RepID=A0A847ST89_9BACT|nr:AraC family transcriptional regulator [Chitinophaga eiseniae]NLR82965.1 helix-turn-helix transcriptional regulator [Chitinophaga eiseniae]
MTHLYENFVCPADESFTVHTEIPEMETHNILKCHFNFKIALIENCIGKRFIGDHIDDFEGPELLLLGSSLPHRWQYQQVLDPTRTPTAYVVHFSPDFIGEGLLEMPEARELQVLFNNAGRGIVFSGDTITQARFILQQMLNVKGLARLAYMIQLLSVLTHSKDSRLLASPYFNLVETSTEGQKISQVFDYIYKNFRNDITLQEVAGIIPMCTSSFCRFFKQRTNKTLVDIIKEVRINHASKLLMKGGHNVTEACYSSGYNSLSNFNKHFREVKGLSPRDYLKQYRVRLDSVAV